MLTKIIDWSGRNRILVLLATLFVVLGGVFAVVKTPLDALPDLSDVQVIVYTEFPGQAPQVVEDQVTYPLTTAMLSVPKSKVVRGFSFFGASFVYVIFEDGTDIYWARSRVLEYLNFASGRMPKGVTPQIGPDATGVGWVYQYAVLAKDRNLAELRTLQDWYLRYQLAKSHGVAEVASLGGFVQTYQVTVDPTKLRAYGIPLSKVTQAIRDSNRDVGGRVVEMAETEYMVRGKGYLRGAADLESLAVKSDKGTPVLIRDIARVELAPDERRGLSELNGEGEVVSGIAMARYGQNALEVIENIKEKIAEISPGLPDGVSIQAVYDRSDLIHRAIETLKHTLFEESLIVALVCMVFLLHFRSALVAIVMLPVGVLIAFIAMRLLGMNSNLMSLGGIAIAIGAMVDAAIVMIENAHKHIERLPEGHGAGERMEAMLAACKEVGPALVLFSADHHRLLPAGVHAGIPGGPALLAPGLHQDLLHGRRRAALGDFGAGADDAVHSRQDHARGEEPREPIAHLALSPGDRRRHALEEAHHRDRHSAPWRFQSGRPPSSAPSSCPRSTKAPCSTCPRRCRACRSPRPPNFCRRRTRSSKAFPRSPPSTARRGAPTPPPTRRRLRCSRRSSTSNRNPNGAQG
jgi:CzcA family heavy metal efflux pump